MNDLLAFLHARLDDDKRVARAVGGEQWHADTHIGDEYNIGVVVGSRGERIASCGVESLDDGDVRAEHIALHDPARELREVEAKRRTLARHAGCGLGTGWCDDGGHGWDEVLGGGCPELGDMALPYASHPDYDERWKP